jgi:hypothetical protein
LAISVISPTATLSASWRVTFGLACGKTPFLTLITELRSTAILERSKEKPELHIYGAYPDEVFHARYFLDIPYRLSCHLQAMMKEHRPDIGLLGTLGCFASLIAFQ